MQQALKVIQVKKSVIPNLFFIVYSRNVIKTVDTGVEWMQRLFENTGVHIPEVMLPSKAVDLHKWSVIACDQYTSQPDYWERVKKEVDGSPSTLNLTFPEIYLKDDDRDSRIKNINESMSRYISQGILEPQKQGFILVDRSTPHVASRKGLILAVDLECYDYKSGSQTLIRATEGTVLDRIPPRVKIRENAPIELPHIMLLIDDPEKTFIEKLFERKDSFKKVYDFELMQGGGHIRGWKVEGVESLALAASALKKLADPASFMQKYGLQSKRQENRPPESGESGDGSSDSPPSVLLFESGDGSSDSPPSVLLFAAGDGNHSLATAKAHWENVKAGLGTQAAVDHPARYALVEVVNVHDEGLVFEPIHRVLFGIDGTKVLENIKKTFNCKSTTECRLFDSIAEMEAALNETKERQNVHLLPFIMEGTFGLISVENPSSGLEVGTLQTLLDELVRANEHIEIDYIHGEDVVTGLGSRKGCMGFYLPVMSKHDLFRTVILDGLLPRKTFSMGEAEEKRYYLECRRIR